MAGAAVFDLDRTAIAGSLTTGFLAASRPEPASLTAVLARTADAWFAGRGETRTTAVVSRQGIRLLRGTTRASLDEAGRHAADTVAPAPWLPEALARHHRAGHAVVLATATPRALCEPFAERHGFDDVIATDLAHDPVDGCCSGEIVGRYPWGKGKLAAVHHWSRRNHIRLSDTTAYTDSAFDLPLLDAVGCPTAVNPDRRLAATAARRRWPVLVDRSVVPLVPLDLQAIVVPWVRNELNPFCIVDTTDLALPDQGPVVVDIAATSPREVVEAACILADLARTCGRGIHVVVPDRVLTTPFVGGIAAALGAVGDDPDTLAAIAAAGRPYARVGTSAPSHGTSEPVSGERIARLEIVVHRSPPEGDRLRPIVRAEPRRGPGFANHPERRQ